MSDVFDGLWIQPSVHDATVQFTRPIKHFVEQKADIDAPIVGILKPQKDSLKGRLQEFRNTIEKKLELIDAKIQETRRHL